MTFKQAVENTPEIKDHYRQGLQGIRHDDRQRIHCSTPRLLGGSLNLDEALRTANANDPRWDYGIGVRISARGDIVIWLEVHPASSLHIDAVLKKLQWLQAWLRNSAPAFMRLPPRFCWLATGRISFRRGSPQEKRIAQKGLRFPVKQLDLDRLGAPEDGL